MADWSYDEATHRYRDKTTGRFVSAATMRDLRDDFIARSRQSVTDLTAGLVARHHTLGRWVDEMRQRVRLTVLAEYTFGRGGFKAMTQNDRRVVDGLVADQWRFLDGFARDIDAGRLSPAQIASRSTLYINDTIHAYEHGRAASRRVVMPVYPGDGGTVCGANCQCSWEVIDETDAVATFAWTLHATESCPDCVARSDQYRRLVLSKGA